jgi:WD40 repeat protein
MRTRLLFATALLVLVACSQSSTTVHAPSVRDARDLVVVATADGVRALDSSSGSTVFSATGAIGVPDWSKAFSTEPDGSATSIVERYPATGATVTSTSVKGRLSIRTVSQDGSQIALAPPLPAGVDVWTPVPRVATDIVVADPSGWAKPERYHLAGNFEPEAFSTDGRELFMIQYLPASAPVAYRVTSLELSSGKVYPVFSRFKAPPERMPGVRLEQILSPDGSKLYTLYTNQPSAYAKGYGGEAASSAPVTFVHILSLEQHWAFCLELPKEFWNEPAAAQAMAASPDGTRLFVVDSSKDLVTEIGTRKLKVLRTQSLDLGAGGSATAAAISADGSTLYVGSSGDGSVVRSFSTSTLEPEATWTVDGSVLDVRPSTDGSELFAAILPAGAASPMLETYDVKSGAPMHEVAVDGLRSIEYVGPLAG